MPVETWTFLTMIAALCAVALIDLAERFAHWWNETHPPPPDRPHHYPR